MLPAPFVDFVDDPVGQTSVCRFRRDGHSQRDAAQAGGRDKVQTGQPVTGWISPSKYPWVPVSVRSRGSGEPQ